MTEHLATEMGGLILKFDNSEQRARFQVVLDDVLNDRWWCYEHGINYVNPDTTKVARLLYESFSREDYRF